MLKTYVPDTVAPPFGPYSHAVEVLPNARWLVLAGQVGVMPDGTFPEGAEAQNEWAWKNIVAILEAGGMGIENIVRTTSFVVNKDVIPSFVETRKTVLGGHAPASTLIVIDALAAPEALVEIEVVAAKV